jgi:hypothetical protein
VGVVVVIAVAVVAFVIAAVVIGREARRLDALPRRPVFDLDEAVEFVANRLSFEVAAELSHDDVRQLLRWHVEYFRSRGVTANGDGAPAPTVVVGGSETVDYLLGRAGAAGLDVTPPQVHEVLEAQYTYLRAIGAIGPPQPPEAPQPPGEGDAGHT